MKLTDDSAYIEAIKKILAKSNPKLSLQNAVMTLGFLNVEITNLKHEKKMTAFMSYELMGMLKSLDRIISCHIDEEVTSLVLGDGGARHQAFKLGDGRKPISRAYALKVSDRRAEGKDASL